jgi:hypothetical protein
METIGMNDFALASARSFRCALPGPYIDVTQAPLSVPENPLFARDIGSASMMLRNETSGMNRARWGDEVEVPLRLNISPKAAFAIMLFAVANLIPVLAPALMRNP